jgi:hypothetical protein
VPAALKPEEERNTQDARSVFIATLMPITQAWSSLTELLNIRRDATLQLAAAAVFSSFTDFVNLALTLLRYLLATR